jgi:predicted nucleotidyltransferase
MVSNERRQEVEAFIRKATEWATTRDDLVAAAIVGSWARDAARDDSDVDLVLLTNDPTLYTEDQEWILGLAPDARLLRTVEWGAMIERRLLLRSGLEIEIGVERPSWARTRPVDPGTRRVVQNGFMAIFDPQGLLTALVAAS